MDTVSNMNDARGSGMKVLVVDDEQLVRWFLERALKKWGYDVVSVSSPKDALSQMDKTSFDILITDLRMPEGNGTELLEDVRQMTNPPQNIVVCSAFITAEMSKEFKKQGVHTLKKPFKLAELEKTLDLCSKQV
jgi:two-component system nitrogen regulation response regulator GlnG